MKKHEISYLWLAWDDAFDFEVSDDWKRKLEEELRWGLEPWCDLE
jgi:hypothetical protein